MEIISEKNNSLLKRKEILVKETYQSNPGKSKSQLDISAHFKTDENTVVVKKIDSKFGTNTFYIHGMVYESEQQKHKIEPKKKDKKK